VLNNNHSFTNGIVLYFIKIHFVIKKYYFIHIFFIYNYKLLKNAWFVQRHKTPREADLSIFHKIYIIQNITMDLTYI